MTFLFKPFKGLNAVCVVYFHMMRKMSIKPSWFNIPFSSLYPRDIVWQIMIFIFGRCYMFPYNDDNAVLARIFCVSNITCFKMGDGVLRFL